MTISILIYYTTYSVMGMRPVYLNVIMRPLEIVIIIIIQLWQSSVRRVGHVLLHLP